MVDRVLFGRSDLLAVASGLVLTAIAIAGVQREGEYRAFALLVGGGAFVAIVVGFMRQPHVLVGATIVYFAVLPTLKVFVSPLLGGTKDLIDVAAVTAAVVLYLEQRRQRPRTSVKVALLVPLLLLLILYGLNLGGYLTGDTGHNVAWFHGTRLIAEPLCLFVVGATLADSRRTLRWGVNALLASCVLNVVYGLAQQAIGVNRLMAAGYTYGEEVRQLSGHLRSFGTADEPFSYAGLLLLGLAVLLLYSRSRLSTWLLIGVIASGIALSYVRTAAVIAAALLALSLARRGYARYAFLLMLSALVAGAVFFFSASQRAETRTVPLNSTTYLTLNGRTNIWSATLHSPSDWILGRGVGATGTASQRAKEALTGPTAQKPKGGTVVDSSYFVLIADVGIVGLMLLAVFFGQLITSVASAVRRQSRAAWLAAGLLAVTLLDALTRESFTGFPTAYIAMLLLGLSFAVWRSEELDLHQPPRARGRR